MYLKVKCVGLLLAGVLGPAMLVAQEAVQETRTTISAERPQSSLLNASEGLSVIGAALETRGNGLSRLDCSHLVHTVYERAGFPYSYASSSDLYAGVDEFQQTAHPHVGDLVVWPGHVGIVVNPAESTFFSSLRTGIGVESYSTGYWKERGAPRFYRYAKVGTESKASTAGLTRAALDASANAESKLSVDVKAANSKFPRFLVIDSAKPQSKEVMQAILGTLSTDSSALRDVDVFKLNQPLIVFSQIEVRAVKIHGHQGQVQVRITALLSMEGGQVNPKPWQQVQTWPMRWRDRKSWDLILPQDAIYLPRETAVRILAHRLSLLADAENPSASPRQKLQLTQMLNTILAD